MGIVEDAGGMYAAVEKGIVQKMIGESAMRFQQAVESGEQTVVGVNAYQVKEDAAARRALDKPDPARMQAHLAAFRAWKAQRSQAPVDKALANLAACANGAGNIFGAVVDAAEAGCTHGEICATLRREMGFGHPLVVV
jgi:methylmalonyl-CoA mutase N-terminal domain/subunit